MTPTGLRDLLNAWPTFVAQKISVTSVAEDWTQATVRMDLTEENGNYYGTAFGGTLFSMVDPFFVILAIQQLGEEYMVWDRAAEIDFLAPGRTAVTARVRMPRDIVEEMRAGAADGSKVLRWFEVDFTDEHDAVIARAHRQLYVRRKQENAQA